MLQKTAFLFAAFFLVLLFTACQCENPVESKIGNISPTITNHTFIIREDVSNGARVGLVSVGDESDVTNFAITAGNSNGAFAINSNGLLTTTTSLDYRANSNYSLTVKVTDGEGNTTDARVSVIVIDILEWQNRYITNTTTNDITTDETTLLNQITPIDGLKGKMFTWLDVSIPLFLKANDNGRLTNWVDKKHYSVTTNTRTSPAFSVSTNTNSTNEIVDGEVVAFTNIVITKTIILSLNLTSPVSTIPKSDLGNNDSLFLSNGGTNSYVVVDYEGDDRTGFAIDTTFMGNSDNVKAFYLVTERIGGNDGWYPVFGYDDLGNNKRFLTKLNNDNNYIASPGADSVGDIVLGDSIFERNVNFPIPAGVHLLSRRGLNISKSDLNGILGSFPRGNFQTGGQRIRELIIFTNTVTDAEHSNIVKYLYDKWQLPAQPVITNLESYYSASSDSTFVSAIDGDISTFFKGQGSAQQNFASNRILFEVRLYGSVLDGGASSVIGLSAGHDTLYLRSGVSVTNDSLKAPFRVEVLRTNDNNWFTLSNVALDTSSRDKIFFFSLQHASNNFLGYRVVANGAAPGVGYWFTIDEFQSSTVTAIDTNSPIITNQAITIIEGLPTGTVVSTVNGTDDRELIASYAIISGNSNNSFQIDNDGVIRISNIVDYESVSNFVLTIGASDPAGNLGTGNITVNVTDGFDDLSNTVNVSDGGELELDGAYGVTAANIGSATYLFVAGFNDSGVSVFSVGGDGSLSNVDNVSDGGELELDGAYDVTTANIGGGTYLFVAGNIDHGVSVFSVSSDGSLSNVNNVIDGGNLLLRGSRSVTTANIGSVTYLFVAGNIDNGVSVFSVGSDGSLSNVDNMSDGGDLQLNGASSLATAVVGSTTYLFVSGFIDMGVSAFSVGNGGSLNNVDNVANGGDLLLNGASSVTTAEVGGTTYLFVAGLADGGVSVFSVGNGGSLNNITNVSDGGDLELNGASSVTTAEVGESTYLFVAGNDDDGLSTFYINNDGFIINVDNVSDGGELELNGSRSVATANIGGTIYLFVAGSVDDGVSVFEVEH